MLGPGLTQLLHILASIDDKDRTILQRAIYAELRLLFRAISGGDDDDRHRAHARALRTQLDAERHSAGISTLLAQSNKELLGAIFEPYQPPPAGAKCKTCGQNFPVMTQPTATGRA